MTTNFDFSRSSLLMEQYHREMAIIDAALQDESQDEHEERLSLVSRSWSLSCACYQCEVLAVDVPVSASVVSARS